MNKKSNYICFPTFFILTISICISILRESYLSLFNGSVVFYYIVLYAVCLVARSCLILCEPMDCSPPGFSFRGDSPGKNTGVGCHALLQGIFLTQGWNPGLPHCRHSLLSKLPGKPLYCYIYEYILLYLWVLSLFLIYLHYKHVSVSIHAILCKVLSFS